MFKYTKHIHLLCFLSFILSLNMVGQKSKDEAKIRECFAQYTKYVYERNGTEAIKYVDKQTIAYYDKMIEYVVSADSVTVQNLNLIDKLTLLTFRLSIPPQLLLKMNGRRLFIYAIDNALNNGQGYMVKTLDIVDIKRKSAIGNGEYVYGSLSLEFPFYKKRSKWKINPISYLEAGIKSAKKLLEDEGSSETDTFLFLFKEVSGKEPINSMWHPIK